jgi:transglutaminase-like putative cysteine protease
MTGWLDLPLLDLSAVDLDAADRVTYVVHQIFRYDYDGPAYDLRQRIVAVPRERHGALTRRAHRISVATPPGSDGAVPGARVRGRAVPGGRRTARADRQGNLVVRFRLPVVPSSVEFEVAAVVERVGPAAPARLPGSALHDPRHLAATRLTRADGALRALAAGLRADAADDEEFAHLGCARVAAAIRYEFDTTSVTTTAAEAYALGRGVCQDSAHVLLALCRAAGVPARYVSGHLLGQDGGSHAWVEVLVRDRLGARAVAVDPSNGCPAGPRHLPVAVGRDYLDVAPVSGRYAGTAAGHLSTVKHAGVTPHPPADLG